MLEAGEYRAVSAGLLVVGDEGAATVVEGVDLTPLFHSLAEAVDLRGIELDPVDCVAVAGNDSDAMDNTEADCCCSHSGVGHEDGTDDFEDAGLDFLVVLRGTDSDFTAAPKAEGRTACVAFEVKGVSDDTTFVEGIEGAGGADDIKVVGADSIDEVVIDDSSISAFQTGSCCTFWSCIPESSVSVSLTSLLLAAVRAS